MMPPAAHASAPIMNTAPRMLTLAMVFVLR